ncbi:MAG TPA: hypothetical protein VLU23_13270 [Pseudolabrys sp.]|jgi:purine-cytosine permease-like protein|nr:hypothetical protein [Pseudolabrys sp.]
MLALIPWDVWAAIVLAIAVALVAIFGPSAATFVAIYVSMCVYIVIETFGIDTHPHP